MFDAQHTLQQTMVRFMQHVYGWMAVALSISGLVAYYVGTNPALLHKIINSPLFFIIMVAGLLLVFGLSSMIMSMSQSTAVLMFALYSVLSGMTLSVIFAVYELSSIAQVFFITSGMFGTMALYGYYTKSDLTSYGNYFFMALVGFVFALLVNLFLRNSFIDLVLSVFGVLLFVALTAYDVQRIKQIGQQLLGRDEAMAKVALVGALTLYLDFVNLFLNLLRLLGKRRR